MWVSEREDQQAAKEEKTNGRGKIERLGDQRSGDAWSQAGMPSQEDYTSKTEG